ncbi:hypothetical protein WG219_15840 [Ectopseudomonas mendocina]|uniref:Strictosidine synthase conserved region domain-containing protein n=1 Tax=Ectopseudomonas mendocina TaxID=300 RepID=A0ABZ2RDB9_ECTME
MSAPKGAGEAVDTLKKELRAMFAIPPRALQLARIAVSIFAVALLLGVAFLLWQYLYPVSAAKGWDVRVAYDHIEKAAALELDDNGNLIVSSELNGGKGSILSIAPNDVRTSLIENLSKPDGLTTFNGALVFSQEAGEHAVSSYQNGVITPLFQGDNVQGLLADGDNLYAIEDRKGDGRLLRYDASDKTVDVLRSNLNEAETVQICPNRQMYYNEKEKGVVRRLSTDGTDPVVLSGLKEPSFLYCDARGLWVSEDRTHRARLLLLDNEGNLNVILTFLKAPQELIPAGDGKYLLAEGGRDRVLEITAPK